MGGRILKMKFSTRSSGFHDPDMPAFADMTASIRHCGENVLAELFSGK